MRFRSLFSSLSSFSSRSIAPCLLFVHASDEKKKQKREGTTARHSRPESNNFLSIEGKKKKN